MLTPRIPDFDVYDYLQPHSRVRASPRRRAPDPHIEDDWPPVPAVTSTELDILDVHLGAVLDSLLGIHRA